MRKIRIGIDVGGTFTDAVAIDDTTYEIIAQEKIPTTHQAEGGVAEGIIRILQTILTCNHIDPGEVIFIAHGTTQATNALLEGDVARVGIVAMGDGWEAQRADNSSTVGNIPLAQGKELQTEHVFIKTSDAAASGRDVEKSLQKLREKGISVIVATEPFSVDHPENEQFIITKARERGLYATGGHEVSRLYGLRVRTRTAVINGSLIPTMMETADMTERCVREAHIDTPLMIMRCDGGVMTIDEVRRRPILTMLSGLAAGVAGALMYEKLSDGIFLESGGTSTDISVIRNGRVMVRYAQVGGHKTYLHSLDVRTLGVAGGSMIRVENGRITDVGPRSAHIAGLDYEVYSPPIAHASVVLTAPRQEDEKAFAAITGPKGQKAALTLAGAANVLGLVPQGDYAAGQAGAARIAWQSLGTALGITAQAAAQQAMDIAVGKISELVEKLIQDYKLDKQTLCLAGGGGSAGIVMPALGKAMDCQWKIVKNAPIISTIGVALAMVREVVERTVVHPTDKDIVLIRHEALERVMRSGAKEETVEITIEIDKQANTLRAIAVGATEFRTQELSRRYPSSLELKQTAAVSMHLLPEQVEEIAATGKWHVFEGQYRQTYWGLWHKTRLKMRVLDREGVIHLQKDARGVIMATKKDLQDELHEFLEIHTEYGTVGGQLPHLYLYYGEKQLDLSGLAQTEQIDSVLNAELQAVPDSETVIAVAVK